MSTLVCRSGGIAGSAFALVEVLRPSYADRPLAMVVSYVLCLILLVGACILTTVNFRRPEGPQYRRYGILQIVTDTVCTCSWVFWGQFYDSRTAWPLLLIPIVTAAQRVQLRGTLAVWAVALGSLFCGALSVESSVIKPEEIGNAVIVSLIVAILCGAQSNASVQQVSALQKARRQLEHQAGHDALTTLPNRTSLERHVADLDGRALAVLLLDLDGFKHINDTLGHAAGDEFLRTTAQRITGHMRAGDLPGRLGGDEFLVLLTDADQVTAEIVADRLRASICEPVNVRGQQVQVGVSVGVVCRIAGDAADFELLAAEADAAMYRDKLTVGRPAGTPSAAALRQA